MNCQFCLLLIISIVIFFFPINDLFSEKAPEAEVAAAETDKTEEQSPPDADLSKQMKMPPAKRLKHVYEENPFKFIDSNEVLLRDWPKIKYVLARFSACLFFNSS